MGRTLPVECHHGVTVDWGDFGYCQGDCERFHPENLADCPDLPGCDLCEQEEQRTAPLITCDPRIQFGAPCVAGTRITAETIAEMVWAGDPVDALAADYDLPRNAVLWCCAWWVGEGHLRKRRGDRRTRWLLWSEHALLVLGGHRPGPLCDPDDFATGSPAEGTR